MTRITFEEELQKVVMQLKEKPELVGSTATNADPTSVLETIDSSSQGHDIAAPAPSSNVTLKNLYMHPEAHPVVLDLAMLLRYGAEWLTWEPETVQHAVAVDLKGLSHLNFSKLMAMKTLHLSDAPWKQWEVFLLCAMPLNGLFPDFDNMQVPSVSQCLVAVDIMKRTRDMAWSDEVKTYLSVVHRHDGVLCTQPPLDFVKVDTSGIDIDCDEVTRRWPDVKKSGKPPTEMTMVDEQLRRLLICYENLQEHMDQLRHQLPLVQNAT